ncbi:anion permease [Pseudothermotoga sp. U03pept]|uniref:inorganic phosphate transporter n=1 Tax=Pseudothermotoga sp. U03pept TaxID=3447012 RepID=UPI003F015F30
MDWLYLLPGIALGIVLGANDGASIFGPQVAVGSIRRSTAVLLSSVFVVLGAFLGGTGGMKTLGSLTTLNSFGNSVAVLAASITVVMMISLKLPGSVSQSVVGALLGVALISGTIVRWTVLLKIASIWVATPLLATLISFLSYRIFAVFFRRLKNIRVQDFVLRYMSLIALCYSAYSLGANNVANVAGPFLSRGLSYTLSGLVGGFCISIGILGFSKRMTFVIGKSIILLDHFSSLVAAVSTATNVFIFSLIGVPVSATQSAIGTVIGVGMSRGEHLSSRRTRARIVLGLTLTPCFSGTLAVLLYILLRRG